MKTKNPGSNHKKIIINTEMTRLENLLNRYNISAVPHQQIERTVESLRQYVPKKQSLWNRQAERLADVLSTARQDAPFFSWGYWLAGIVLFFHRVLDHYCRRFPCVCNYAADSAHSFYFRPAGTV